MRKQATRKAGRPPGGVDGQRVRDYPQVSIRVPPKLYAQLNALSRSTGLSRLEIFMRAIDCYEESAARSAAPPAASRVARVAPTLFKQREFRYAVSFQPG